MSLVTSVSTRSLQVFGGTRGSSPCRQKRLKCCSCLVRRRDIIVSREELLDTVWRDTFVEDGNINYTVSLLRKVLDKDDKGRFIQTVPKRGYRFVADVLEVSANGHAENAVRNVEVAIPTEQPKPKIRWHFIGIVLLGVFFVTGFVIWRSLTREKNFRQPPLRTEISERSQSYL